MLAAFQICSSACSSEYCTKGCLIFSSFKYFLDLVQRPCRESYVHGMLSFRYWMFFMAFNIFFKVKILWHLWRYCKDVISSLPTSLMMSRTGITLDFCGLDSRGFQQIFSWVEALQCHLLNSGKCSSREPAVLDRCINLLNSSCF